MAKTVHGCEILDILYTRGDASTQPGGIVLAKRDNHYGPGEHEYIAWNFNRKRGTKEPTEYFWGRYCRTYEAGLAAFRQKAGMARQYDAGGSLMESWQVDTEIAKEINSVIAC